MVIPTWRIYIGAQASLLLYIYVYIPPIRTYVSDQITYDVMLW